MRPIATYVPDEIKRRFKNEIIPLAGGKTRPKLDISLTAALLCILNAPPAERERFIKMAIDAKTEDEKRARKLP